jgi:Fe2+ transport system protein FeoA
VLVWVDLELPALASVPEAQAREREALRQHIDAQQEDVMRRLRALGAVEQARVRLVRNALAVRLPGAQLQAARRIPGVRALQLVRDVERPPLIQGD